jgi:serine/threonine protein kinase
LKHLICGKDPLDLMNNIGQGTIFGKRWTVAQKLGEGGCASVYALKENDPTIGSLVIKCTKLPTGKSKADKEQMKIANTLNYERMLYKGVLTGFKYCVKLPTQNYYGEEHQVRYLVMGRLDYDLRHLATCGATNAPSTQTISLLGTQILEGLELLHAKGYLFVDVKPDNFMIKKDRHHRSGEHEFTSADELYFVDFGLAEKFTQYLSNGAQRERTMRTGLAGTPSYASIDLLEGHSPCRKDDLEALVRCVVHSLLHGP